MRGLACMIAATSLFAGDASAQEKWSALDNARYAANFKGWSGEDANWTDWRMAGPLRLEMAWVRMQGSQLVASVVIHNTGRSDVCMWLDGDMRPYDGNGQNMSILALSDRREKGWVLRAGLWRAYYTGYIDTTVMARGLTTVTFKPHFSMAVYLAKPGADWKARCTPEPIQIEQFRRGWPGSDWIGPGL